MAFSQPLSHHAIYVIKRLPGVLKAEGFRDVPAKLSVGYRSQRVSLNGIAQKADLHRLIDDEGRPLRMPPDGLVVSARLVAVLSIRPGGPITIEVLKGERQTRQATLIRPSGDLVGVATHMDQHALTRLLGEDGNWSGIRLSADQHAAVHLYTMLKRLPAVNAAAVRQSVIASLREIMDESARLSMPINFAFVCVAALGAAFNDICVAYSEHIQQLISLCVLGFTQAEVAWILLEEQLVFIAIVLPAELLFSYGAYGLLSTRLATNLYRLPLVVHAAIFAYAFIIAGDTVVYPGLLMAAKIRRLDTVAVLKARKS